MVRRRRRLPLSILLISSDWHRKGGPFCVKLIRELKKYVPEARLIVVGKGNIDKDVGEQRGYLNKWDEHGASHFKQAFADSHFIILPSYQEAYGMALWEGAAHGLPMLGRATGGISSIIQHGTTGLLFKNDTEIEILAQHIINVYKSETYEQMSENAYQDYQQRGNWAKFVQGLFN
jgi:glycosyltransferase involved in cell wall biosynthesis